MACLEKHHGKTYPSSRNDANNSWRPWLKERVERRSVAAQKHNMNNRVQTYEHEDDFNTHETNDDVIRADELVVDMREIEGARDNARPLEFAEVLNGSL